MICLRALAGCATAKLPLALGEKKPALDAWQKMTLAKSKDENYQRDLSLAASRGGNIGVVLGDPSDGLCTIDIDDDSLVEPFLILNPKLRDTLRTRGARGCQLWVRSIGDCPSSIQKLNFQDGANFGEWRTTGGQSVVFGQHPSGCRYTIEFEAPTAEIAFAEIRWPDGLVLPWLEPDTDRSIDASEEDQEPAGDRILREEESGDSRVFPKMSNLAFYGTLGDIAKLIEPITEADTAAVLAQICICSIRSLKTRTQRLSQRTQTWRPISSGGTL
jgi:Bifunctional DNA primase/polymerase, N-terminal